MSIIGYTPGTFDMFHIGHLNVLRKASELCDELVVGVTVDELCVIRKGKAAVIPYAERAEIVANVCYVDRVIPQTSSDKMQMWNIVHFDALFVGDDWRGSDMWIRIER